LDVQLIGELNPVSWLQVIDPFGTQISNGTLISITLPVNIRDDVVRENWYDVLSLAIKEAGVMRMSFKDPGWKVARLKDDLWSTRNKPESWM